MVQPPKRWAVVARRTRTVASGPGKPFVVKDCALAAIATGIRAQNARELGDRIQSVPVSCIYHHFWGGLLQARFGDREYNNDFAHWARLGLHDIRLAERLGLIDPAWFEDLEDLRQELIETIDDHLHEADFVPWAPHDQMFHFIRSQIIVFDTHHRPKTPRELADLLPNLSVSSIFYHFIDARRRGPKLEDDFRTWLKTQGADAAGIVEDLGAVDPYFVPLTVLRDQIATIFREHTGGDKP